VRRGAYVGVRIETFLAVDVEGGEAEWTSIANNRLDGSGWKIERVVMLQTHYGGELHVLASHELPEVTCPDSLSLARRLPGLVDELLALPIPDAPDAAETRVLRISASALSTSTAASTSVTSR